MEMNPFDQPLYGATFRSLQIDGGNGTDFGIGSTGGQVVCINGNGELPQGAYLFVSGACPASGDTPAPQAFLTINPVVEVPGIPEQFLAPTAPIPEPSVAILLAMGAAALFVRSGTARRRSLHRAG